METCTNCGATLRSGAKFCTTCGTRLNEMPTTSNDGWGTPRTEPQNDSQETTVLQSVQPQGAPSTSNSAQAPTDSWSSAYGTQASSSDDPASRFISALDNDVTPVKDETHDSETGSDSSWGSSAPVFTPPPPSNWSYGGDTDDPGETDSDDETEQDSSWETPSTWATTDESDDDDDTVTEPDDDPTPALPPDELRDKAISLADELRQTVRLMSSGGEHDHGAAVMALTEASLQIGDFSDVRGALAEVRNDPRDIETLTNLAGKIDRIESLLDGHKSLADAIETAIRELNG